jgi:hypothetical protein
LIAAGQPERREGARDRTELHGGDLDQVIVILPLAAAVVQTFLPDQQPFAVFGPVERSDRSFALADGAAVVDRAGVDLDLELADLLPDRDATRASSLPQASSSPSLAN